MREQELVDHGPASEAGNLRWSSAPTTVHSW
jgi:hypothetical protein